MLLQQNFKALLPTDKTWVTKMHYEQIGWPDQTIEIYVGLNFGSFFIKGKPHCPMSGLSKWKLDSFHSDVRLSKYVSGKFHIKINFDLIFHRLSFIFPLPNPTQLLLNHNKKGKRRVKIHRMEWISRLLLSSHSLHLLYPWHYMTITYTQSATTTISF